MPYNKLKILLVDDEPELQEVMAPLIKNWGYDYINALDGKAALSSVIKEKPDIVILDYKMPGMDGIAALKEIRKVNNEIPVIIFTAYPDAKVIDGAEELGVVAFVPKFSVDFGVAKLLKEAIRLAEINLKFNK